MSIPVHAVTDDASVMTRACRSLEKRIASALRPIFPKDVDAIVTVQFTDGQVKVRIQPPDSGWLS